MIPTTRGRPRGAHRAEFTSFVSSNGQFTMGQLAKARNWTLKQADQVLRRAIEAREVHVSGTMRVDQAKRPVAVYAPGALQPMQVADALRAWAR